jgi:hypothetical protein
MTIAEYLIGLVDDPERLSAFRADPAGELSRSGLNGKQQELILSGDAQRIQHVVEYESDVAGRVIVCAIVCTPERPPSADES